MDTLRKLFPWNAPVFDVARLVEPRKPLLELSPRPLLKEEPLWPNDVPSVCPEPMWPVNPRLPLTDRDVPPNEEPLDPNREPLIELPVSEAIDPERDPDIDELPKCEPSMFDTPRFGEIELRVADDPSMPLRPAVADPLLKFPAREFDATDGEFDPREAPAAPEADELPANERAVELPAVLPELTPACVPAVFPVLGPRALPVLPENECQLPSAFARVAPRPAGQPEVRAFNEFERPALDPAPLRAFDEFPPDRPPYAPLDRPPPYPRDAYPPPRPYAPRAALLGGPPRYAPPPPRYAPPPPRYAPPP